jgi:predicted metal-dependent phosphoesterase TrpH
MDYYDVSPRVVPADQVSEIVIRPRFAHAAFREEEPWQIEISQFPFSGLMADGSHRDYSWGKNPHPRLEWSIRDGALVFQHYFAGEQEHNITVSITKSDNACYQQNKNFRFYSLKPDWYGLRPFKGDFHIHTTGSDGRECPEYVAARYRQKGFDFAAISDHRNYQPSLAARDFYAPLGLDFRLFPGEEVHSPGNPVHIVNFAGDFSITERFQADEERYQREVAAILATMKQDIPQLNYFPVAASQWVCDRIREAGGLAVFAHPYWYVGQYVISEALTDALFAAKSFDAFEILGGFYKHQFESNNFQVLRYYEEQAKGNRFPVVGLSDSHGTDSFPAGSKSANCNSEDGDLFGWYYTIVLAASDSREDIIAAIKDYRSVAVCAPSGSVPMMFGDSRMVRFANFLFREYFPWHAILCQAEGAAMLDHLAGDASGQEVLKTWKGRVPAYREACYRDAVKA